MASVALVGAGPGDPELLTLRGARCLQRAEVVLYDGLSNPSILRLAPQAEHICVGKHGRSRIWTQEEINTEIIHHAHAGKRVVRLKGGDPAVFARTAEEVDVLRANNIPYEIVPGITAALAAGSYAGIPVTYRGIASAVALVTGHEEPSKSESALDWQALAHFPGTLVIYMGVTTVQTWATALLDAGKPPATPTAIIRRCSLPDQQVVTCTLREVADLLTPASKFRPPVIVIIGPVASLAETKSWFDQRSLFGQRILVTRAEEQADELTTRLSELGAEVFVQPAITISPLADNTLLDQAIAQLDRYDWLVFSSRNGVRFFMQRLLQLGKDARALAACKLAVVGSRTADALQQYSLHADCLPCEFHASALAKAMQQHCASETKTQRILLLQASRGKETLANELTAAGAEVTQLAVYRHADVDQADEEIIAKMEAGEFDWTTVTSSAIANSLVRLFGPSLHKTRLASLSPLTSATLTDAGFPPSAQASVATMHDLAAAIVDALTKSDQT